METDWLELWRELVIINTPSSSSALASRYKAHMGKKNRRPDDLLNFILERISSEHTVLDIGAGGGRWTIPIASIAGNVTALEPSADMRDILRDNIDEAGLSNINIVPSTWEESVVEPQDIVVSAHAMYSSPDFDAFIRKMERHARKACYVALRLPAQNGIVNELSFSIYGRHHDSPNAIIAYNALYSMGIYVNVLVENSMHCWVNDTFEEAFARAKKHLHLEASSVYDGRIRDMLKKRLIVSDGGYMWPDGMRSALLWWTPSFHS